MLAFGLVQVTLLVVTPSSHIHYFHYFVFLLLAWTAVVAELIWRPLNKVAAGLWAALIRSYAL